MSAGQVMTGFVVSRAVTLNWQVAALLNKSVTVYTTVEGEQVAGKKSPGKKLLDTVMDEHSVKSGAVQNALALHESLAANTVMSAGQLISFGATVSATVTSNVQLAVLLA